MQTDKIQAGVAKARWMPQMMSVQARVVHKVPDDGSYHVILLRENETVVVVDLFCCMFLNAPWDFDLCFLDVHQVRTIVLENDAIYPYSKIKEAQHIMIEKLLASDDFRRLVDEALNCEAVLKTKFGNRIANKPPLLQACSDITKYIVSKWKTTDLQMSFEAKGVSGEWNECAVAKWFHDENWQGFGHD